MEDIQIKDNHGNGLDVQGMNQMLEQFEATVPNRKQRSQVVEPGANFAQDNLWRNAPYIDHPSNIPSRQYLGAKYRKPQHLKDANSVTHKPNQYMDGSTDVGFIRQAAPIARWVNLGTYRQNGNSFIDHTFQNLDYDTLFGLEAKAYQDILKHRNNN